MISPNSIDLTTLASVKGYLTSGGAAPSASDDDLIQSAITGFSQWVLLQTGRDALSGFATYTEIQDGNGGDKLWTRNIPIAAVTLLQINGVTVSASTGYGVAGYFIEQTMRSVCFRSAGRGTFAMTAFGAPYSFLKGRGNIQISYTAGYLARAVNELHTVAAQTIALGNPNWYADEGVLFYPTLIPLVLVASNPAAGQYAVANGLYVFNATDNAAQIVVSYQYAGVPSDLEFAARQTVAINYRRKAYRDLVSKSVSVGGGANTTSFRDWQYPPEVGAVIQNYRRYAM